MVWDLPIRVFHWGLATTIIGAYITGENGIMDWHARCGLAALGLIIFRIIWGFIGHETARFRHFLRPPAAVLAYARGFFRRESAHIGHNPLGGYAVIAMLALFATMAGSGLFADDGVLFAGPLQALMPHWGAAATDIHTGAHRLILPLLALHLVALILHRLVRGERLVMRMVTGGKAGDAPRRTRLGLLLLVACVATTSALGALIP